MIYKWFVGNFKGTIPWNTPHCCIICLMLGAWEEGRVGAGGYWSMQVSCTSTTHHSEVRNLCFNYYIDASLACDDLPAHKKISPCLWAKHTIQKGSWKKKQKNWNDSVWSSISDFTQQTWFWLWKTCCSQTGLSQFKGKMRVPINMHYSANI